MSAAQQTAAMLLDGSETAKEFIHRARGWQGIVATNGFTKLNFPGRISRSRMYQKVYYTIDTSVVLTLDAPVNRYFPVNFTVFIRDRRKFEKQLFVQDYRVLPQNIPHVIDEFEVLMASDDKASTLIKMIQVLMGNNSVKNERR
jgi:hypothetical protein